MQFRQLGERRHLPIGLRLRGRRGAAAGPPRTPVDPDACKPDLLCRDVIVVEALRNVQDAEFNIFLIKLVGRYGFRSSTSQFPVSS